MSAIAAHANGSAGTHILNLIDDPRFPRASIKPRIEAWPTTA